MNTSLKNALVGSVLVLALAILLAYMPLGVLFGIVFGYYHPLQSLFNTPNYELAFGGAVAGLIAGQLRFAWLPKPEVQRSRLAGIASTIARNAVAGALFGAICGALTVLVFLGAMSFDPQSTFTSITELMYNLSIAAAGGAVAFALICGVVGALWGIFKSKNFLKNPQTA